MGLNSLSYDKIVEVTKLKGFADDKLNISKMMISLFDRIENTKTHWGKEKMLVTSVFPTVFSKVFFFLVVKFGMCGNELTVYHTIPTLNNPEEKAFGKHCGKRRKCWYPAFFPFFHNIVYLSPVKL